MFSSLPGFGDAVPAFIRIGSSCCQLAAECYRELGPVLAHLPQLTGQIRHLRSGHRQDFYTLMGKWNTDLITATQMKDTHKHTHAHTPASPVSSQRLERVCSPKQSRSHFSSSAHEGMDFLSLFHQDFHKSDISTSIARECTTSMISKE